MKIEIITDNFVYVEEESYISNRIFDYEGDWFFYFNKYSYLDTYLDELYENILLKEEYFKYKIYEKIFIEYNKIYHGAVNFIQHLPLDKKKYLLSLM
jgi:hypothetical protein